jgi:CTP:molybdopterin cytidylyltransferase MocA
MKPRAAIRLARALWIVWAVIVWNVVFDHVIVVAGRNYIYAAGRAAAADPARFLDMDDWMRPAVTRAAWAASGSAGAIILTGLVAIRFAASHEARSESVEL